VVDEGGVGLFERLLDETGHEDVAADVDVLADIEPSVGRTEPQLDGLLALPRQRAGDGPFVADVESHGGIAMGLQAIGQVVKGAGVADLAGHDATWEVGDLVGQRVPDAFALVVGAVVGGLDGVALDDERVEVNHLDVVM
jgi:hypothetical protein